MNVSVSPFGNDARLVRFAPNPGGRVLGTLRRKLLRERPSWDVAIGDGCLLVVGTDVERELPSEWDAGGGEDDVEPRSHELRVVYDGSDLEEVARLLGVPSREIVALHTRPRYEVEFPGFLPGFAYLRGLDPRLQLPRRATPRPWVPAGTVAIAAEYTALYPHDSPGGWHLLGRVLGVALFDVARTPPALFEVGDEVRFVAAEDALDASPRLRRRALPLGARPGLVLERAAPGTTLQDEGRPGSLGIGLPPSGPLDPERYAAACAAVGSPKSAAIELPPGEFRARARGRLWVSLDGGPPRLLRDGEPFVAPSSEWLVSYLAVSGGFASDVVLGSRSTHLLARFGGHVGRGLRAGDELAVEGAPTEARGEDLPESPDFEGASSEEVPRIFLDPGPDHDLFCAEALGAFLGTPWRIGRLGDRTGRRLEGGRVPVGEFGTRPSFPMRRGAVQIAMDGTPIVLGPDHPTTGGYPVIARVRPESWGAFGRLRPGARMLPVFRDPAD